MTLIRTGILNGFSVLVKVLTLLGVNKVLAIYVGPAGYAVLGQFQNALQMITTFSTGTINFGVTKLTAEYGENELKQRHVWSTAAAIIFCGSISTMLLLLVFNESLSIWFLKDKKYSGVFICLGFSLLFLTTNTLLLAILVGKKEVERYVLANIAGSLLSLSVVVVMATNFGLYGALIALATYQSVAFFSTLALCYKKSWFRISYFFYGVNKCVAIDLGKYVLMALTTTICTPVSYIFVRNILGHNVGWEAAGYWEAMVRLSSASLMLVSTTLGIYFLPKITQIKKISDIKKEMLKVCFVILPVTIFFSFVIYILRDFIVLVLFTKDFYPMRELFAWQMLGDVLRVGGWIFMYIMQGKGMMRLYISSEVVSSIMFVCFAWLFTSIYGGQGVVIAHAANYLLYLAVVGFVVWRKIHQIFE
ncbi:O-antigen translocase [Pseudomonas protegens]|uniref:O-antigen translocase n=1 Tax=Pseudomonas protegens TaxID=380021 RepID=UPI0038111B65